MTSMSLTFQMKMRTPRRSIMALIGPYLSINSSWQRSKSNILINKGWSNTKTRTGCIMKMGRRWQRSRSKNSKERLGSFCRIMRRTGRRSSWLKAFSGRLTGSIGGLKGIWRGWISQMTLTRIGKRKRTQRSICCLRILERIVLKRMMTQKISKTWRKDLKSWKSLIKMCWIRFSSHLGATAPNATL